MFRKHWKIFEIFKIFYSKVGFISIDSPNCVPLIENNVEKKIKNQKEREREIKANRI